MSKVNTVNLPLEDATMNDQEVIQVSEATESKDLPLFSLTQAELAEEAILVALARLNANLGSKESFIKLSHTKRTKPQEWSDNND